MNRKPIEVGEWYHCYTRGVDKRLVFRDRKDRERFLSLLFIANSTEGIHISNLRYTGFNSIAQHPSVLRRRSKPLIELAAYCLMPNHVHIVAKEIVEGGIASFMQKVFTGYTMYFNKRNERTGALFSGTYKSKHIADDEYLKQLIGYVHMNPAELFDPGWKRGSARLAPLKEQLLRYEYSSLRGFLNVSHPERAILGTEIFELYEKVPRLTETMKDAQEYYRDATGTEPSEV